MREDQEKTNEILRSVIALCNTAIKSTEEYERLDTIEDAETEIRKAIESYWYEEYEEEEE
tara:strand:+ start:262 stop:441 length:180 start_codon:yes stop_codon:yes gene_type:complete